jgi:hypothetical protein
MNNLAIWVEVLPGSNIRETASDAIALGQSLGCDVAFRFNGIRLRVSPTATPERIESIYHERGRAAARRKELTEALEGRSQS